jgi:ligand-binding sensor domain-containing protein/serine phosphatase RsbU (regulator of sigma subunit)
MNLSAPILHFYLYVFIFLAFAQVGKAQPATSAHSLDPNKKLSQYILEHWDTERGLLSNNVRRMLQTQDGFLWFGGFGGLTRFDGMRFTTFNKRVDPIFKTNSVFALAESPDGVLWAATEGSGVLSYDKGVFKAIGNEKLRVTSFFAESKEKFWLGTRNAGLYSYEKGILQALDYKELTKTSVFCIRQDARGRLWFGTDNKGITYFENGKFTSIGKAQGLPAGNVVDIFHHKNGDIWVGTTEGLAIGNQHGFKIVPEFAKMIVYRIIQDSWGSIWMATSNGLYRRNILTNEFEKLDQDERVVNVQDILIDHEESLWIATYRSGLFRLKDGKFTNYTHQDGLAAASVGSICQIAPKKFLVGMNNGKVNQIDNGKISLFPLKTPLSEIRIFNIFQDNQQNLWFCTFEGLIRRDKQGNETHFTRKNGLPDNIVRLAYQDKQGRLWFGTRSGGLLQWQEGDTFEVWDTKSGLASNFVLSIKEDRDGNLLIGTDEQGLHVIDRQGKINLYDTKKGLISNRVFSTYTDTQGVTWLATDGGITRWEAGKFTHFTFKEGLLNDSPFDFVEDMKGNVWLPTSDGIVRVEKRKLNLFAQGKIKASEIGWIEYDRHDGMKNEDCTGAAHSILANDGTVWIPTNGGVVVVNPNNMPQNHLKPRLSINSVHIDLASVNIHQNIKVRYDQKRVVFDYSALSLLASAKVRFKYKLEGYDTDWEDAGNNHEATYTNLPPGKYKFKVIACNNDGVWNYEGATLTFERLPHFTETWWFFALMILLLVAITVFGVVQFYTWRISQIEKRRLQLERLVEEKTAEISAKNETLTQKTTEISLKNTELNRRNENITNSINYAKRIQEAMLPTLEEMRRILPESFLIFEPKDIVSGDFYWVSMLDPRPIYQETLAGGRSNMAFQGFTHRKIVVGAVDCTGHGVPGALMSMIGNELLHEIIHARQITEPDKILNELHKSVTRSLRQRDNLNRDGMDVGLCVIDMTDGVMEFAGAKSPLYYMQEGEFYEIRGTKLSIGGYYKELEAERVFSKTVIPIDKPTYCYLMSDGLQDQFGGDDRKKFSRQRLRDLFREVHTKEFEIQKVVIKRTLNEWRGNEEQVDDILLMGFKIEKQKIVSTFKPEEATAVRRAPAQWLDNL